MQKGQKDKLHYYVLENRDKMGELAANIASERIKKLMEKQDEIRIIFASAPSQNEVLQHLIHDHEIDWARIVGFHMDEYIGLPQDSDQLFQVYIRETLTSKVDFKTFHFIDSSIAAEEMIKQYTSLLKEAPIDIVCLGIGENGHIAFNDPPVADFHDPEMIKQVQLDEYSRQQQVNDGCFASLTDVPTHALTLTIPTLISAKSMICTVPGPTKTKAVGSVLNDEISTACPATILRKHNDAHLILDSEAFGSD